ncbi:MAG: glycosyltransferase family 39 protein [Cyclobacteriaceae bacterium]
MHPSLNTTSIDNDRPLFSTSLGRRQRQYLLLIMVLAVASFFVNLGLAPLKHEEPRRALIALEMLFQDNWVVPTEMGEYYYKKPPLYNWVVIAGFGLFRNYSEFAVRFFSMLSFLGMGVLVFLMCRRYVGYSQAAYAGLLTWVMVDILFYFSATAGEIDLFYSFITLGSFFTIYHFYQRQQYYALFITTYALGALGALTKGLPSPVFLAVSLGIFFLYQGKLRKLFGLAHLTGLLTFALIVGGYFWWYDQYHPFINYFTSEDSLWSQSSERTMLQNKFTTLLPHLFLFPLETLKNVAPASLLLLFTLRKDILTVIRRQPFILFCLLLFLGNVAVYWISPGTRSRYVYMLYPLLVTVLTYCFVSFQPVGPSNRFRWFHGIITALIALAGMTSVALPFIPQLELVPNKVAVAIVANLALVALLVIHLRKPAYALLNLILLAVILRFIFAWVVLPYRAQEGSAAMDKTDAYQMTKIVQEAPLYLYQDSRCSLTTVFYLEREREAVLRHKSEPEAGAFFLADRRLLTDVKYDVFYTFTYDDLEFVLIRFRER